MRRPSSKGVPVSDAPYPFRFGAPTHRLESQIQATAKVLELQCQVIYLLNFMIISFQDEDCHTSDIKFIKQSSGSDLGKLIEIATLHWEVMHDKIGVQEASAEISRLMKAKPLVSFVMTHVQFSQPIEKRRPDTISVLSL